jgi:hypothetical protein
MMEMSHTQPHFSNKTMKMTLRGSRLKVVIASEDTNHEACAVLMDTNHVCFPNTLQGIDISELGLQAEPPTLNRIIRSIEISLEF